MNNTQIIALYIVIVTAKMRRATSSMSSAHHGQRPTYSFSRLLNAKMDIETRKVGRDPVRRCRCRNSWDRTSIVLLGEEVDINKGSEMIVL